MTPLKMLVCLLLAVQFIAPVSAQNEKKEMTLTTNSVYSNSFTKSISFSPDRKWFVVRYGNAVMFWDLKLGKVVSAIYSSGGLSVFEFSPDGKTIAIGTGKVVKLWNIKAGHLFTLSQFYAPNDSEKDQSLIALGHMKTVRSATFSPDGKMVVTGSGDKTVKFWDVKTGQELRAITGNTEQVNSVAFSPDGKILALGGGYHLPSSRGENDFTIKLWDVKSGQLLNTLSGETEEISSITFSSDSKTIASVSLKKASLWNVETGKELATFPNAYSAVFSPDGKTVAISSLTYLQETKQGTIKLWSIAAGKELLTLLNISSTPSATFSTDGKTIAASGREGVKLWDVKTGLEQKTLGADTAKNGGGTGSFVFFPDGQTIAAVRGRGFITLWDVASGRELAMLMSRTNHIEFHWAVITRDQRFDTNALEGMGLSWFMMNGPARSLSLEIFARQYLEPDLLQKVLNREILSAIPSISEINLIQPTIGKPIVSPPKADGTVDVTVEVEDVQGKVSRRPIRPSPNRSATPEQPKAPIEDKAVPTSGVYDLRLYRDDQLVGQSTPHELREKYIKDAPRLMQGGTAVKTLIDTPEIKAWREANDLAKVVKFENGKATYTFKDIKLPRDIGREIFFSAYAFNSDRVKSDTSQTAYVVPKNTRLIPEPRRAFIITFGVNKHDNPQWDLKFAGNDARAMSEIVSAKLREGKDFADVIEIPLISDNEIVNSKTIEKRHATKGNIQTVFELLAGKMAPVSRIKDLEKAVGSERLKKLRPANPDDMILISFSSHGYADQNGIFYLVPTDIGKASGKTVTAELLRRSISSDELSLWLGNVDVSEMVMIVDACHSAAAVQDKEFKPAPMGSRGLGQLSYDKGMRILTATQIADVAYGFGALKQGLLTYVLLKDGLEAGKADFNPVDRKITVSEWLEYGEQGVPNLLEEASKQAKQSNAPVELKDFVQKALSDVKMQRPSLFDFSKKRPDLLLVRK